MVNLNMYSDIFAHSPSSTWYKKSEFITWDYGSKNNNSTFYIDNDFYHGLNEKNDKKLKFLWGLESPKFNGGFVENVKKNLDEVLETFELIFTYSDELIDLNPKFVFCPANGHWIEQSQLYDKTKLISMICSGKQHTEQQKFRVDFANSYKDKIDIWGYFKNPIKNKEEGLKDYMFSVCVENETYNTYFTEKILDCFATGTIPIYKGTKNIINHFNENGIIFLDDINIDDLNEDLYYSKFEYIKENFEKVQQYNVLENWIYKKYLNNIL